MFQDAVGLPNLEPKLRVLRSLRGESKHRTSVAFGRGEHFIEGPHEHEGHGSYGEYHGYPAAECHGCVFFLR